MITGFKVDRCPFCRRDQASLHLMCLRSMSQFYVRCICGACGPDGSNDEEAVKRWNERNSPIYGEHPTTEKSSAVGNAAAWHEALVKIEKMAHCDLCNVYPRYRDEFNDKIGGIEREARAALKQPPRNCDLPLVVDGPANNNADKAWLVFKRHNPDAYFDVSGLLRCIDWLLATATERRCNGRSL